MIRFNVIRYSFFSHLPARSWAERSVKLVCVCLIFLSNYDDELILRFSLLCSLSPLLDGNQELIGPRSISVKFF